MADGIPARLSPAEGRKFGLTVGAAFLALAALFLWRGRGTGAVVTGCLGALLVIAGLLIPAHLGPVQRAWMRLALVISKVTTPVFMAIIYFAVFTPAGLLRRRFRNTLVRASAGGGYWVMRDPGARRSDLKRQF